MKVKNTTWFTQMGNPQIIGIIIGEDEITGEIKAYVGSARGEDESVDANHILQTGAKFHHSMAVSLAERLSQ